MLLPKKKKPNNSTVKRVDAAFSKLVRHSSADHSGRCRCVTCGASDYWQNMDAGHFIPRAKMATRWDRRNVKPQCPACNRFAGGKPEAFAKAIDAEHGQGTSEELRRASSGAYSKMSRASAETLLREICAEYLRIRGSR